MPHQLWETHQWEIAKEEAVVAALFDAPQSANPLDFRDIDRYHPTAKAKYLNLFYGGQIPSAIKKLHKI
ncbi:MAG: hypothetical protein HC820_00995 [Hydrococcus sp. RM1_1_31]|nr:hypothetical protein [Hydrococcus sp. RM1_1_31]